MWTKKLLAAVVAVLLIVAGVAVALVPAASAAGAVHLDGSIGLDRRGSQPALVLSADGPDGYHLESTLTVVSRQSAPRSGQTARLTALGDRGQNGGREREDTERHGQGGRGSGDQGAAGQGLDLSGPFTLTTPGSGTISGQSTGVISQDGSGSLDLADGQSGAQMRADFQYGSDGQLGVDLSGIPGPTPPVQSPATTAATAGSQPANGDHTFWYLSRAAGLSAYLMLFLNVVLGLAVRTRPMDSLLARWRSFDLHQFTALLAAGFLALHALALLGDQYVGFTPAQLVIPFASPYRPLWTALGVLATYLLLAIYASSYLRRFIGYRTWKAIHFVSFLVFLMVMGHGIFAGTDTREPWAAALYGGSAGVVVLLSLLRFRGVAEKPAVKAPQPRPSQADEARAA